jgi:hypothetical protein
LLAVNRPAVEEDRATLDSGQVQSLFGGLPVRMLEDRRASGDALQGEIWRLLLFGMLVFLLVEGWLVLPAQPVKHVTGTRSPPVLAREREPVEANQ